ncbi:outer membrane protein assembly factor BamB family protein [Natrarchaeobius chitinivorans]|nr:PQQ-binding-like beta-propeller repeat protein [Natrarchaeobius chitinivorans]
MAGPLVLTGVAATNGVAAAEETNEEEIEMIFATGGEGSIAAIDRETGETLWSDSISGEPVEAGAVSQDGETVYAGDRAGQIVAFDAATGEEQWTFEWDGAEYPWIRTLYPADDELFVGTAGLSGQGTMILSVDKDEQTLNWVSEPYDGAPHEFAMSQGELYTIIGGTRGSPAGQLAHVDQTSGEPHWIKDLDSGSGLGLHVDGEGIYTSSRHSNNVSAFDRESRELQWAFTDLGSSPSALEHRPGSNELFVGDGDDTYVLDKNSGTLQKTYSIGPNAMAFDPTGEVLYAEERGAGNTIVGADPDTGEVFWTNSALDRNVRTISTLPADGPVEVEGQVVDAPVDETGPGPIDPENRTAVPNATVEIWSEDGTELIDSMETNEQGQWATDEITTGDDASIYDTRVYVGGERRWDETSALPAEGDHVWMTVPMSDPELSSPTPSDDFNIPGVTAGTELEVTVTDPDFPSSHVYVEFYDGDDQFIGDDLVFVNESGSSATVSMPWFDANEQGVYEWYAVASDPYLSTNDAETDLNTFEIRDDPPIIYDSTASPDGETVSGDVELSIDVDNPNFPDDDVTVEFYEYDTGDPDVDELIGTDTLESNGTAKTEWPVTDESLEWYVVAESELGHVVFSRIFSFGVAGDLEIRDATSGELIDDRTVKVDVTAPGQSYTTYLTDGVFDIGDLEAHDETVRFDITAMDYYPRTVELRSTVGGVAVYLERGPDWEPDPPDDEDDPEDTPDYEDDENKVLVRFELTDNTGDFPPEDTTLRINDRVDNETRLVHSETFGPINRVDVILNRDERYQLEAASDDGGVRGLGGFTASESEVVPLEIGELSWPIPVEEGYEFDARFDEDTGDLDIRWIDDDELTRPLQITVRDYESGQTVFSDTHPSFLGEYRNQVALETDRTYEVEAIATRDGETIHLTRIIGPTDMDIEPLLGPMAMAGISALAIVVVAGIVGGRLSSIGSVIVSSFGALLVVVGWLPIPWPAILVAFVVSVLFYVGDTT